VCHDIFQALGEISESDYVMEIENRPVIHAIFLGSDKA
jgi:hypothetical protein